MTSNTTTHCLQLPRYLKAQSRSRQKAHNPHLFPLDHIFRLGPESSNCRIMENGRQINCIQNHNNCDPYSEPACRCHNCKELPPPLYSYSDFYFLDQKIYSFELRTSHNWRRLFAPKPYSEEE